ncbi:MAG: phospholipid carrier-dependent glycosyltransferase, partial [Candidatus Pacebacteria bacterium]|nr:phospholipid carrier-dependent glycosyltransferase [Candidatus Paceibacterota bacterium]
KDEWGRSWPLALESFGDYKLPGYVWITIGSLSLFGLNDWAVRLPSALAGTGLVILAYFWAKNFHTSKLKAWFFALVIAVSPVFFFYSRMAFEANLALSLWVLVLLLLFKNHSRWPQKWLDLTAIGLALFAIFTYNTPLILLPFVLVALPLWRGLKNWQQWLLPMLGLTVVFVIGLLQLLPLVSQKGGITIFSDELTTLNYYAYRTQFTGLARTVIGNRYLYYLPLIIKNYLASFSPRFLVTNGGAHPWHTQPDFGHLTWLIYGLGLLGLFTSLVKLFKVVKKQQQGQLQLTNQFRDNLLMIYLLIISLVPAAITVDAPHATRSLLFFFMFSFFAIKGLATLKMVLTAGFLPLKNLKPDLIIMTLAMLIILAEASNYFYHYFVDYPNNQATLKPGFDQVIRQVAQQYPQDQLAIVDGSGYQYILLAWYLKIPAQQYLTSNQRLQPDKIGFSYGERVGRFHFIAQSSDKGDQEKVVLEWSGRKWLVKTF